MVQGSQTEEAKGSALNLCSPIPKRVCSGPVVCDLSV